MHYIPHLDWRHHRIYWFGLGFVPFIDALLLPIPHFVLLFIWLLDSVLAGAWRLIILKYGHHLYEWTYISNWLAIAFGAYLLLHTWTEVLSCHFLVGGEEGKIGEQAEERKRTRRATAGLQILYVYCVYSDTNI